MHTDRAKNEFDAVIVGGSYASFSAATWLLMREDLKASRRTGALLDHLARGLLAYVAAEA